jgi:exo-beta-1,3-glucanase (GH17 family)
MSYFSKPAGGYFKTGLLFICFLIFYQGGTIMKSAITFLLLLFCYVLLAILFCSKDETSQSDFSATGTIDLLGEEWIGNAICYSGYREGQNPQKYIYPSQDEIQEDLEILEKNWKLIRVYGSDQHSEDILQVIRRGKTELKVMLGAWLDKEPGYEEPNTNQIETCIRLANEYTDIVVAVNVGNEILVHWTSHPVPEVKVISYVKQVQAAVSVPVTVADDFNFWRQHGAALAEVVDFVTMHTYPIWGGKDIDEGLSTTIEHYQSVKAALPNKKIVIGEAGWATYTEGDLHAPKAGDEQKQKRYFGEISAWAQENKVTVFFFEAFDEPWKGTGTEGHWGLFSEGRKAKLAMREWYPNLLPDGPTSPDYSTHE